MTNAATIADLAAQARLAAAEAESQQIAQQSVQVASFIAASALTVFAQHNARAIVCGMLMAMVDVMANQTTNNADFVASLEWARGSLGNVRGREDWLNKRTGGT